MLLETYCFSKCIHLRSFGRVGCFCHGVCFTVIDTYCGNGGWIVVLFLNLYFHMKLGRS